MTTKEFIEKAMEGGWQGTDGLKLTIGSIDYHEGLLWGDDMYKTIYQILLDPNAWEAVGKIEGWEDVQTNLFDDNYEGWYTGAQYRMHQMIGHLIEGGTITSYLETL